MLAQASTATATHSPPVARAPQAFREAPSPRAAGPSGASPPLGVQLFVDVLNRLDHGALVVSDEGHVWHSNNAATSLLAAGFALHCVEGQLRCHDPADAATLIKAIRASADRGLQGMVVLGRVAGELLEVAVLPLPAVDGNAAVLLLLGRQCIGEALTVQWYARAHRLTPTETSVLEKLCEGCTPVQIAASHQVGIATVRTQINAICQKTGTGGVRKLVDRVARLPPMTSLLAHRGTAANMIRCPLAEHSARLTLNS